MKCIQCEKENGKQFEKIQKAIFSNPNLCKGHFIEYFETKVKQTINQFSLATKKENIVVATSGGKDSTTILFLLNKFGYKVEALAIDEGISNYRNLTLNNLKKFCKDNKIKLRIFSFKKEFGKDLDSMLNQSSILPCSLCGAFRRNLLNKYAKGYDKIATGHNLDDEVQSIVMNFIKNNLELNARLGPKTGLSDNVEFVQRIKPLYLCTEKEVLAYSFIKNFEIDFVECPHVKNSFRSKVRDMLNNLEEKNPGSKKHIVENFLMLMDKLKKYYCKATKNSSNLSIKKCKLCNSPSDKYICKACDFRVKLNLIQKLKTKAKT